MVLRQGKCLHTNSAISDSDQLEYIALDVKETIEEIERWHAILSVNYANYCLKMNCNDTTISTESGDSHEVMGRRRQS